MRLKCEYKLSWALIKVRGGPYSFLCSLLPGENAISFLRLDYIFAAFL